MTMALNNYMSNQKQFILSKEKDWVQVVYGLQVLSCKIQKRQLKSANHNRNVVGA